MSETAELSAWRKRVALTENARNLLQLAAAEDGPEWVPFAELPTLYEAVSLVSKQVRALETCPAPAVRFGETEFRHGMKRVADMLDAAARELAVVFAEIHRNPSSETAEPAANVIPLRKAA